MSAESIETFIVVDFSDYPAPRLDVELDSWTAERSNRVINIAPKHRRNARGVQHLQNCCIPAAAAAYRLQ